MKLPPVADVDVLANLLPLPSQRTFDKPLASNDALDAPVKDLDPKPTVTFDLNDEDQMNLRVRNYQESYEKSRARKT